MEQLKVFVQLSEITVLHHLLTSSEAIDEIDLEETAVKMMGTYDPAEPLSLMIKQLEKGIEFACAGGWTISNSMMVSKGITILEQTATINENIR